MKASVIIGAGYGDEGKGLFTDYLASKAQNSKTINIRFSGGQQAGHTVVTDEVRHTFSNFGSGTIKGLATYYTEHTVFYPLTMAREEVSLSQKGIKPGVIYIHPLAKMTTPFDVYANQFDAENLSHGTCGLGVGKTMQRNQGPIKLYAMDLLNLPQLLLKLDSIAKSYGFVLEEMPENFQKVVKEFITALQLLPIKVMDYEFLKSYDHLIFEGSQGILLDMSHGVFPHVTYAHTTSKNAMEVIKKLGITNTEVYYITRTYHTRHGNGPFPNAEVELVNNSEEHNTENFYQGKFKTGELDYGLLNYALRVDATYHNPLVRSNLVITCNDQLDTFKPSLLTMPFSRTFKSYSANSKDIIQVY